MTDTLRRVTVHAAGPSGGHCAPEADLVLPAGCPLGALMPAIVHAVVGEAAPAPARWRLSRAGGGGLDNARSLAQQGVDDGELMVLSVVTVVAPQPYPADTSRIVAAAADRSTGVVQCAAPWAGCASCVAGAVVLGWSGALAPTAPHPWAAGALSAVAVLAAVAASRSGRHSPVPPGAGAVALAATAGMLAVPQAPWAATLLLAAAAALTMSTVLLGTVCRGSAALCALVTVTGSLAAVAAAGTVVTASVTTAGAALSVLALTGLSAAPRLAVAASGVGPAHPALGETQARAAHAVLTGLVAGFTSAAALGVSLVAITVAATATVATVWTLTVAVVFIVDVGLLLLLRRRTHVGRRRRAALGGGGVTALGAAALVVIAAVPGHAYWVAVLVAGAGLAVSVAQPLGAPANPVLRQCIHLLEYGLLVAVIPLAAWVAGVYRLVRGLGLA